MNGLARSFGFAVLALAAAGGSAQAGFFAGAISAHFENPVLSGSVYRADGTVDSTWDNTSTATYNTYGDGTVTTLLWGSNAGGPGYSLLNFFPNQNVQTFNNQPFELGTVTYFNGTSQLNSL